MSIWSGTSLQAPSGPEVGAEELRTGMENTFLTNFGIILGSSQVLAQPLFLYILYKSAIILQVVFESPSIEAPRPGSKK